MNGDVKSIRIVCQDPRHAGKIAKLCTYYRNERGRWHWQIGFRRRAVMRRSEKVRAAGDRPDTLDIFGPDRMPPTCKLCGKKMTLWSDDVVFPILNRLAADGVSSVSLRRLNLLVSNAKG